MMTIPGPSRRKSGFFISVGCPGCGGKLELDENFFVLTCDHCNSILRIRMPNVPPIYLVEKRVQKREVRFNIDRYLRNHDQPLTGSDIEYKRIYYPFWRVEVIVLKARNKVELIEEKEDYNSSYGTNGAYRSAGSRTIKAKKTDISLSPQTITFQAGYDLAGIPPSLGLRVDCIRAVPFSEDIVEDDFQALPVVVAWTEARNRLDKSIRSVAGMEVADFGRNRTEYFRPIGSLVYFPYFIAESYATGTLRRWVVDGVTGRVETTLDRRLQEAPDEIQETGMMEFGQLSVEHHRCGNCGYDLPEKQSYVYMCQHCLQLIVMEPHPQFQPEISVTTDVGNETDRLMPFWSLRLSENLLHVAGTSMGDKIAGDRIIIPAFRLRNFEAVYRLTRRITSATSKLDFEELTNPDKRMEAVEVGPSEALILAEVVCARERMALSSSMELPGISDRVKELSILFAPFHPEHYFYVDSILGAVTFEKSLLK